MHQEHTLRSQLGLREGERVRQRLETTLLGLCRRGHICRKRHPQNIDTGFLQCRVRLMFGEVEYSLEASSANLGNGPSLSGRLRSPSKRIRNNPENRLHPSAQRRVLLRLTGGEASTAG